MIWRHQYSAPTLFNDVLPGRVRLNARIPWFSRATMVPDAESGFKTLARYIWDRKCFASIPVAALSSPVWADFTAVDDVVLSYRGSSALKRVQHVSDVLSGLNGLPYAPFKKEGPEADF